MQKSNWLSIIGFDWMQWWLYRRTHCEAERFRCTWSSPRHANHDLKAFLSTLNFIASTRVSVSAMLGFAAAIEGLQLLASSSTVCTFSLMFHCLEWGLYAVAHEWIVFCNTLLCMQVVFTQLLDIELKSWFFPLPRLTLAPVVDEDETHTQLSLLRWTWRLLRSWCRLAFFLTSFSNLQVCVAFKKLNTIHKFDFDSTHMFLIIFWFLVVQMIFCIILGRNPFTKEPVFSSRVSPGYEMATLACSDLRGKLQLE